MSTQFAIHLAAAFHLSFQTCRTSITSKLLEKHAIITLNSFQRAGYFEVGPTLKRFEFSAFPKIRLSLIFTSELQVTQAPEIVSPRILASRIDGFREMLIGACTIFRKVGVNTQPVKLAEYSLLGNGHGGEKEGKASEKKCESPNHNNRLLPAETVGPSR